MKHRNGFALWVDCYPRPNAAHVGAVGLRHIAVLLPDESPDFIHFDFLTGKLAHRLVHEIAARHANADAKPHHGVAMNAGGALSTANRVPFAKKGDRQSLLFGRK